MLGGFPCVQHLFTKLQLLRADAVCALSFSYGCMGALRAFYCEDSFQNELERMHQPLEELVGD